MLNYCGGAWTKHRKVNSINKTLGTKINQEVGEGGWEGMSHSPMALFWGGRGAPCEVSGARVVSTWMHPRTRGWERDHSLVWGSAAASGQQSWVPVLLPAQASFCISHLAAMLNQSWITTEALRMIYQNMLNSQKSGSGDKYCVILKTGCLNVTNTQQRACSNSCLTPVLLHLWAGLFSFPRGVAYKIDHFSVTS